MCFNLSSRGTTRPHLYLWHLGNIRTQPFRVNHPYIRSVRHALLLPCALNCRHPLGTLWDIQLNLWSIPFQNINIVHHANLDDSNVAERGTLAPKSRPTVTAEIAGLWRCVVSTDISSQVSVPYQLVATISCYSVLLRFALGDRQAISGHLQAC
jgi:hypothetical protein